MTKGLCNSCGRAGPQHTYFRQDEIEAVWAQGIVLTFCDQVFNEDNEPDGVIVCTTISVGPDNPSSSEELKEISC